MLNHSPRRFWKEAAVVEDAETGGYAIALDGRIVKAPSRQPLAVPTRALAEAMAEEWNAQGETLDPRSMPLTQLANTAQDRVGPMREAIIEELMRYVDGDVLCYRASDPEELVERQAAQWEPVLEWAKERFGCAWAVTEGLMPVAQDQANHEALKTAMEDLDTISLTGLQVAAPTCGSLLLGFALLESRLTAVEAFEAAFLEELYQAEQWGEDREAAMRRGSMKGDLENVQTFLVLARAA